MPAQKLTHCRAVSSVSAAEQFVGIGLLIGHCHLSTTDPPERKKSGRLFYLFSSGPVLSRCGRGLCEVQENWKETARSVGSSWPPSHLRSAAVILSVAGASRMLRSTRIRYPRRKISPPTEGRFGSESERPLDALAHVRHINAFYECENLRQFGTPPAASRISSRRRLHRPLAGSFSSQLAAVESTDRSWSRIRRIGQAFLVDNSSIARRTEALVCYR